MIAAVVTPAPQVLACEMVAVDPLLGAEGAERRSMILDIQAGRVTASGWDERLAGTALRLRAQRHGWLIEGALHGSDFAPGSHARLTRASGSTFALEWGVVERRGRKGELTYSLLAHGNCRQTAGAPLTGIHQ